MSHTFNVSTCAIFVARGGRGGGQAWEPGDHQQVRQCGCADGVGAKISCHPSGSALPRNRGVTFFFAPHYHPAFKSISPVRRKLAERKQRPCSIFSAAGESAHPTHQLVGVFDRGLVGKFAEVLRLLEVKHALVVHGDGLDELSTMGSILWRIVAGASSRPSAISVCHYLVAGVVVKPEELFVRRDDERRHRAGHLERKDVSAPDIVILNAAAALVVAEKVTDLRVLNRGVIDSGAALEKLDDCGSDQSRVDLIMRAGLAKPWMCSIQSRAQCASRLRRRRTGREVESLLEEPDFFAIPSRLRKTYGSFQARVSIHFAGCVPLKRNNTVHGRFSRRADDGRTSRVILIHVGTCRRLSRFLPHWRV